MDFTSDFTILPCDPSQIIDSGSEDNAESPVFKRRKRPSQEPKSSPPSIARKRRFQPKVVRRSLGCEFLTSCDLIQLAEDQGEDVSDDIEEEDMIETSPSPLMVDMKSQSPSSSQMVSSCQSSVGLHPQPVETKDYSLLASSVVSNLVDESLLEGSDELEDNQNDNDTNVSLLSSLLDSGKKRKRIKNGLFQHLTELLDQKKSRESLERYQTNNANYSSAEVKLRVVSVERSHDILVIHGEDQDVMINTDFLPKHPLVDVGDVICFTHPRISKVVKGRRILLGVLHFTVDKSCPESLETEPPRTVESHSCSKHLRCPCLTDEAAECCQADWIVNNNRSEHEESLVRFSSSDNSSGEGSSQPTSNSKVTVSDIVSKFGGSSSSPQTSYALTRLKKVRLEVLIHYIFFYGKTNPSPTLVCEDNSEEFVLVKIPSELREDARWNVAFGQEWFSLVGSRIVLSSPFNIQDRLTRGHSMQVFALLSSLKTTHQRYCYVLKCCPGSSFTILNSISMPNNIKDVSDSHQSEQVRTHCRVRILCIVAGMMYVTSNGIVDKYNKIVLRKSFGQEKFLNGVTFPMEAVLRGLWTDQCGVHSLDGYSSITHMTRASIDISGLPIPSSSSVPGDLVKIEGMVSKIDPQLSQQWMECSKCGSDELVNQQANNNWFCVKCDSPSIAEHKIELVCRVGLCWTRLHSDTARTILPSGDHLTSFHPADVIGQVVSPTLAVIGQNMIADECKVNH